MKTKYLDIEELKNLGLFDNYSSFYIDFLIKLKEKNMDLTPFLTDKFSLSEALFLSTCSYHKFSHLYDMLQYFGKDYSFSRLCLIFNILNENIELSDIIFNDKLTNSECDALGWLLTRNEFKHINIDYQKYLFKGYNSSQLVIIFEGLIKNKNVSLFDNVNYDSYIMRNILDGLIKDDNFNLLNYVDINEWLAHFNFEKPGNYPGFMSKSRLDYYYELYKKGL